MNSAFSNLTWTPRIAWRVCMQTEFPHVTNATWWFLVSWTKKNYFHMGCNYSNDANEMILPISCKTNTILTKNENETWYFCFAHLRWCHNWWAFNILIVMDTGYTAGIHHSKYWMLIHYDTIEDGQNKKYDILFSKCIFFYSRWRGVAI